MISKWVAALVVVLVFPASARATTPTRGYVSRACGFDTNHNGVVGEAGECNYCDGVTADPDGDGIDEDINYISCDTGTDNTTCGAVAAPCKTIEWVRAGSNKTFAHKMDGAVDGAEDIACVRGTCTAEPNGGTAIGSGVPGTYTLTAAQVGASALHDQKFPSNPWMLIGWDLDDDGDYPPHDTDDTCAIGSSSKAQGLLVGPLTKYAEVAHCTFQNYGNGVDGRTGWMDYPSSIDTGYFNFHDLALKNIDKGISSGVTGTSVVINELGGGNRNYVSLRNIECMDCGGGWFVRGGQSLASPSTFSLIQNLSVKVHSCDTTGGLCAGASKSQRTWEFNDTWFAEDSGSVIDSVIDCNPAGWPGIAGCVGLQTGECNHNMGFVNNEVKDFTKGFRSQGPDYNSGCTTAKRSATGLTLLNNWFHSDMLAYYYGTCVAGTCSNNGQFCDVTKSDPNADCRVSERRCISIEGGDSSMYSGMVDATITNNICDAGTASPGFSEAIYLDGSHGGTCPGPENGRSYDIFYNSICSPGSGKSILVTNAQACGQSALNIKNNIIGCMSGGKNISVSSTANEVTATSLTSDYNVFDSNAGFDWQGISKTTLALWRSATSPDDAHSKVGDPIWSSGSVAPPANCDLHRSGTDTIALKAGVMLTSPTIDFDRQSRGTTPDIGADQVACTVDADCNDSLFCNGTETCDAVNGCQAGTPPNCSDGVSCTVDTCNETTDTCDYTPNDAACDDGLFCNGTETCDAVDGCQAGSPPSCNDGVSCTVDACNETSHTCEYTPNDGACSDGVFCNGMETCDALDGCQAGSPPGCNDGVSCTVDACNETTGTCDHTPNDAACGDGLSCNGTETCDALDGCQAGTPQNCSDGVSCTVDACDETTHTCDHTPNDAACGDGLSCNGTETCDALDGCQAGLPPNCNDGVSCTVDACNETTDTCDHTPNNAACGDGSFCNGSPTCDPVNGCQAGTVPNCNDGVSCTVDTCNETTDACDHTPNNAACDDGLFCNGTETCDALAGCQVGMPNCDDGVSCTIDGCDETTDTCNHTPDDTVCDDGLFCNGTETCDARAGCQAGAPQNCNDGVICTVDACNETADTCDHTPNNAACGDGQFCNGTETCDALAGCQAGTAPNCNDGVSCTVDACNETADTCDHTPNDAPCGDGQFCNGTETCDALAGCQAGTPQNCNDGVSCTVDACNETADTCDHTPNDAPCSDSLFCNGAETCSATLACQAGTSPDTNDGIACTVDACNEATDIVTHTPSNALCDDGNACTTDVCAAGLGCGHTDTCAGLHIVLDPSSMKTACGATAANNITVTGVPVTSLPNRMLVVAIGAEENDTDCNMADSDMLVSYAGLRLTLAVSALSGTKAWRGCSGVFYLLNPPAGTANVNVTFPAKVGDAIDIRQAGAFVLYNVAQQAPQATKAAGANATTNPVNTSITPLSANSWVVDIITQGNAGTFTTTQTGQTLRWQQACGAASSGSSTKEVAAAGPTLLGWSHSRPKRYSHALAAFAPISASAFVAQAGATSTTVSSTVTTASTTSTNGTKPEH